MIAELNLLFLEEGNNADVINANWTYCKLSRTDKIAEETGLEQTSLYKALLKWCKLIGTIMKVLKAIEDKSKWIQHQLREHFSLQYTSNLHLDIY